MTPDPTIRVRLTGHHSLRTPGKVAFAELSWTDGLLAGLRLTGFAIYRRADQSRGHVTMPQRAYSVLGQTHHFTLLRPVYRVADLRRLESAILDAFELVTRQQQTPGEQTL